MVALAGHSSNWNREPSRSSAPSRLCVCARGGTEGMARQPCVPPPSARTPASAPKLLARQSRPLAGHLRDKRDGVQPAPRRSRRRTAYQLRCPQPLLTADPGGEHFACERQHDDNGHGVHGGHARCVLDERHLAKIVTRPLRAQLHALATRSERLYRHRAGHDQEEAVLNASLSDQVLALRVSGSPTWPMRSASGRLRAAEPRRAAWGAEERTAERRRGRPRRAGPARPAS